MLAPGARPEAADHAGAEVGDDVAVEVGEHDHVVLLRPRHELVAEVVDDAVLELDVRDRPSATSRATSRNSPSENFMMLALWAAVTFLRPFSSAYSKADSTIRVGAEHRDRLDRDAGVLAGRRVELSARNLAQPLHLGRALLELDAGVQVLGVLADDHDVRLGEARAHALVGLAGPDARVEVELLAQRHVDRAEAGADRRGGRALDREPVAADRVERAVGERRALLLVDVDRRRPASPSRTRRRWPRARARVASASSGPVPSPG